jgi:hypothetical protein
MLAVKKSDKESVQTAIRLPRETYEWLRARPEGITDTIKRGIVAVMFEEMFDAETLSLASNIMILAKQIQKQTGAKWHRGPKAHAAFAEAVRAWLDLEKPAPLPEPKSAADELFGDGVFGPDDPLTLGRAIARTMHDAQTENFQRFREELISRSLEREERND